MRKINQNLFLNLIRFLGTAIFISILVSACSDPSQPKQLPSPSPVNAQLNTKTSLTFNGGLSGEKIVGTTTLDCGRFVTQDPTYFVFRVSLTQLLIQGKKYNLGLEINPYDKSGDFLWSLPFDASHLPPKGQHIIGVTLSEDGQDPLAGWESSSGKGMTSVGPTEKAGTLQGTLVRNSDHSEVNISGQWSCPSPAASLSPAASPSSVASPSP